LANLTIAKSLDYKLPICILGKTFKPNTNITTGSCSILLKNLIIEKGYEVEMYDPNIDGSTYILEKRIYFIGTKHDIFKEYVFPPGSYVIDPHRYIEKQ